MSAVAGSLAASPQRRVVVLGLRGIPNVQGGVETHVAALATRLVQRGWNVEVLGRSPYLPKGPQVWTGVRVTPIWAPRSKSLEAIVHTALGLLVAARRRPDVIHIHAIGPALLTPFARLTGARVVVTHHGFDYDRQKWGGLARAVLRLGERLGMSFAHARIGVSSAIAAAMRERYGLATAFIPNGVEIVAPREGTSTLAELGLVPRRYVLMVARIVEEKRQLDLVAAFARLADPTLTLVLAGGSEHGGRYLGEVEAAARAVPNAMLVGPQTGEALAQLYANAALFVLPSSHEGMPIVLLEALGYGLPVLASDISAHLALDLGVDSYFPLADVEALAKAMRARLAAPFDEGRAEARTWEVAAKFCWARVAEQTLGLYEDALSTARGAMPRHRPDDEGSRRHGSKRFGRIVNRSNSFKFAPSMHRYARFPFLISRRSSTMRICGRVDGVVERVALMASYDLSAGAFDGMRSNLLVAAMPACYRVEVHTDIAALADHWPRAGQGGEGRCHVFQTFEFLETWRDTYGRAAGTTALFVGVHETDGTPLLLLPLAITRRRGARVLSFMDAMACDYNAPVLFPTSRRWTEARAAELWAQIVAALPPFDLVSLVKLPQEIGGLVNPLFILARGDNPESCHGTDLTRPWAEVERTLAGLRTLRKSARALERIAPVRLVIAQTAEERRRHLQVLLAQKQRRFEETQVPGFGEHPEKRAFFERANLVFADAGALHLCGLHVGDEIVATAWGLIHEGIYYGLMIGSAGEEWARYSPGRILHHRLVKALHEAGCTLLDCGIGDESWKLGTCDRPVRLKRHVAALTWRGHAFLAAGRAIGALRTSPLWRRARPLKWILLRQLRDGFRVAPRVLVRMVLAGGVSTEKQRS